MLFASRSIALFIVLLPAVALAWLPNADVSELQLAYIDPGAGSFVVQALIAMVAGIAVTARVYWTKIKSVLGLASVNTNDDDDDPHADDD